MFHIKQSLSEKGGNANEDLIKTWPNMLMLLDGSTSLIKTDLDAVWFTRTFADGMDQNASADLASGINGALDYTRKKFTAAGGNADADHYPSAAGAFVRDIGGCLEIAVFGDCIVLIKRGCGSILITDPVIKHLDEEVLSCCVSIRKATGGDILEIVKREPIQQMLLGNRKKMNKPDGYRILAFNMPPCSVSDIIRVEKEGISEIVMYSDGFDAVAGDFTGKDFSVEASHKKLRALEEKDRFCNRMPRFKKSDDASILVASVI